MWVNLAAGRGQTLANEVMGHCTCGTIGRVVRDIVAEVFQEFPLCRKNCTIA